MQKDRSTVSSKVYKDSKSPLQKHLATDTLHTGGLSHYNHSSNCVSLFLIFIFPFQYSCLERFYWAFRNTIQHLST